MKEKNITEFSSDILAASAAKFIERLAQAGWTQSDINRIAGWSDDLLNLSELAKVIRGEATLSIEVQKHVIHLDQKPRPAPRGQLVENKCYGQMDLGANILGLHVNPRREPDGHAFYSDVKASVADEKLLNLTALQYLLAHQALIPKEWEEKDRIYFLGTIEKHDDRYMWCSYMVFDRRDSVWRDGYANITHYELGNRYPFMPDDAVAIIL